MVHTGGLNAFGMPRWPRRKPQMRFPSYGKHTFLLPKIVSERPGRIEIAAQGQQIRPCRTHLQPSHGPTASPLISTQLFSGLTRTEVPASSQKVKTVRKTENRLTRLPAELRLEVYRHLFRGQVYAAIRFDGMLTFDINAVKCRYRDQDVVNILRTCRLFRTEAMAVFRQFVTVIFQDRDLSVAFSALFSTTLDPTELKNIGITGPYSETCLPVYLQHKCPKMDTLQLTMFKDQFAWWDHLIILLDCEEPDLDELAQDTPKLEKLFLDALRYDWLANGRIAEVSDDMAYAGDDWPRVSFSAPVTLEKHHDVPLKPDCDGGTITIDPKTKTAEWEFRGVVTKVAYECPKRRRRSKERAWDFRIVD